MDKAHQPAMSPLELGLIHAFSALPTHDSRQKVIEGLLRQLTPYEWRKLHALTSARSFQFDIITKLPVELAAHVFALLPPATPFRLQHVSKPWRHVLSSVDVLKSNLLTWFDGIWRFADTDIASLKQIARDVHAFRHGGRPHGAIEIQLDRNFDSIMLFEDTLIWAPLRQDHLEDRRLSIFNIKTWTLQVVCGEAREEIKSTFASDELAGFTTFANVCYVFDLSNGERRKFRVPNPDMLTYLTCRGRIIACASLVDDCITSYIWSYDTRQGTSFTVAADSHLFGERKARSVRERPYSISLLLQTKTRRVVVFIDNESDVNAGSPATIRYATFDFAGNHLRHFEATLDGLKAVSFYKTGDLIPVDRKGTFRMLARAHFQEAGIKTIKTPVRYSTTHVALQFDEQAYRFTNPGGAMPQGHLWLQQDVSWWKDTSFIPEDPAYSDIIVSNVRTKDQPWLRSLALQSGKLSAPRDAGARPHKCSVLVNDKFVVVPLCSSRFLILCYDSSVDLPVEHGQFYNAGRYHVISNEENRAGGLQLC